MGVFKDVVCKENLAIQISAVGVKVQYNTSNVEELEYKVE